MYVVAAAVRNHDVQQATHNRWSPSAGATIGAGGEPNELALGAIAG